MKHTPGPWRVIPKIDTGYMLFGGISYLGSIEARLPSLENEANAHLIAAAPELLEALIKAKEILEQAEEIDFDDMAHIAITSEDGCDLRDLIESVIAKARGEA